MGYQHVNSAAAASADLSTVTTAPIDTTGATLLVAVVSASSALAPSDSAGNTWTPRGSYTPGGPTVQIWDCVNPVTSASHTLSAGSVSGFQTPAAALMAFKGGDTASPFESRTGAAGSSVTSQQPGSVTPVNDGSLLIAGLSTSVNATPGVDGGFSQNHANSSVSRTVGSGYLIQGAKAAANPTFSWTGSGNAAATIAVYRPAPTPSPAVMTAYPNTLRGRLAVVGY